MTAFWVIGFFILLISLLLTLRSSHQYRLDGEDEKQRNNVLKLELAMYEYQHQFGRLPRNNQDLRSVMPGHDQIVYFNPYEVERQSFIDGSLGTFPVHAGIICYEYHPANDKTHEMVLIRAYGRKNQILLETWAPSFHGATSATG